ncbi:MAG: hypothetical protein AB7P99_21925, partial [Vicinamibacterales bacterium]
WKPPAKPAELQGFQAAEGWLPAGWLPKIKGCRYRAIGLRPPAQVVAQGGPVSSHRRTDRLADGDRISHTMVPRVARASPEVDRKTTDIRPIRLSEKCLPDIFRWGARLFASTIHLTQTEQNFKLGEL